MNLKFIICFIIIKSIFRTYIIIDPWRYNLVKPGLRKNGHLSIHARRFRCAGLLNHGWIIRGGRCGRYRNTRDGGRGCLCDLDRRLAPVSFRSSVSGPVCLRCRAPSWPVLACWRCGCRRSRCLHPPGQKKPPRTRRQRRSQQSFSSLRFPNRIGLSRIAHSTHQNNHR